MSHSSISRAELERQRQEQLERERQECLRRIKEATSTLNRAIGSLQSKMKLIEQQYAHQMVEYADDQDLMPTFRELDRAKKQFIKQAKSLMVQDVPSDSNMILAMANRIASETERIGEEYRLASGAACRRIDEHIRMIGKVQTEYKKEIHPSHGVVLMFDFAGALESIRTKTDLQDNTKEGALKLLEKAKTLIYSDALSPEQANGVIEVVEKIMDSSNNGELGFGSRVIALESIIDQLEIARELFEREYEEYFGEYVAYLERVNEFQKEPLAIVPKSKNDFSAHNSDPISALRRERELLRELSIKQNERNYIRRFIDEAMKALGMSKPMEMVLSESQEGTHVFYATPGERSGWHVYMNDKMLVMEPEDYETSKTSNNGDRNADRVFKVADSLQERKRREEKQEQFCKLYPKLIEGAQKESGIILSAISEEREPNADEYYTFSISDGEVITINEERVINVQNRDKKRVRNRPLKSREAK